LFYLLSAAQGDSPHTLAQAPVIPLLHTPYVGRRASVALGHSFWQGVCEGPSLSP
jgi:hypothetical protein